MRGWVIFDLVFVCIAFLSLSKCIASFLYPRNIYMYDPSTDSQSSISKKIRQLAFNVECLTGLVSDSNFVKLRSVSKKPIYSLLYDCTCAKNFSTQLIFMRYRSPRVSGKSEYFVALVFHFTPSSREKGMNDGIVHFALTETSRNVQYFRRMRRDPVGRLRKAASNGHVALVL